ncbi:MAG: malate dehydrogenase, partial [Euryarchaeota archaeon]|nr:malate dehydrogenase [Euryarchaeota archaeon]
GRRPFAAGTGSGPEGSRLTVDVRRPWGCGVEEGCCGECLCARSTEDVSPTAILMAKVTILGATGNVGVFAAHTVSEIPYVSDMLLIGRPGREDYLAGCCRDLSDSFAARGTDVRLSYSTSLLDAKDSDVIICTAGVSRRPGQDRNDLAFENAKIVADAAEKIGRIAPDAILFLVTNPVDVMTAVALKYSGLAPRQIFGLGTHLDSMRLKSLIARYFRVHVSEVHTRIIGEHGESMVPLWSATTIGGIRISNLPTFSGLPAQEMIDTVRTSGEAIIRDKGATVYGPGEAIATLVRTILGDENRILTVSSYIKSEIHGIGDVCIGVPARINRNGVFPVPLSIEEDEVAGFRESVKKIRKITADVMERLEEAR